MAEDALPDEGGFALIVEMGTAGGLAALVGVLSAVEAPVASVITASALAASAGPLMQRVISGAGAKMHANRIAKAEDWLVKLDRQLREQHQRLESQGKSVQELSERARDRASSDAFWSVLNSYLLEAVRSANDERSTMLAAAAAWSTWNETLPDNVILLERTLRGLDPSDVDLLVSLSDVWRQDLPEDVRQRQYYQLVSQGGGLHSLALEQTLCIRRWTEPMGLIGNVAEFRAEPTGASGLVVMALQDWVLERRKTRDASS